MKNKMQTLYIRLKKRSCHLILICSKALCLLAFCSTRSILDLVLDLVLIFKKASKCKVFSCFGSCTFYIYNIVTSNITVENSNIMLDTTISA